MKHQNALTHIRDLLASGLVRVTGTTGDLTAGVREVVANALAEPQPDWSGDPARMLAVLARAESFISGFEDDEEQEGVPALLADLRAATAGQVADVPARLVIVCDIGGMTGVFSDSPALIGQPYTTLDYDVEGIEAGRCIKVRQPDGTDREAYAREHVINAAAIPVMPAASYPAADLDEEEV